jgi:hypothetical protein
LPPELDESYWGPPANAETPEDGLRILNVPHQLNATPFATVSAKPGDTIIYSPPVNRLPARYKVMAAGLPADDEAHGEAPPAPPPPDPPARSAPKSEEGWRA